MCFGLMGINTFAGELDSTHLIREQLQEIHITNPDEIKNYLEEQGEEYDENIVEIIKFVYPSSNNSIIKPERFDNNTIKPQGIFDGEYYVLNSNIYSYTDKSKALKTYNRPKGKVSINESISISNKFSASAGIKADYVEAAIGYTIEETNSFSIYWENTYSYPVSIKVYPIYEVTSGELWERDLFDDDYLGTFRFYRALGDEIVVTKNGK